MSNPTFSYRTGLTVAQGAWDNYIANNTAMDPGNLWPMNLDIDSMGAVGNTDDQANSGATRNAGGVFMGATMPNGGGNMM